MPTRHQGPAAEIRALNAFIALLRAAHAVSERTHGPIRAAGLTLGQFGALEALHHCGPLSAGELAVKVLSSGANMTTILDNLERRGLLRRERDDADRRRVIVRLAPAGRRLVTALFPAHAARLAEDLAALTVAEQEQLRALCRKLGRRGT
jgi:MarR family 2-MHQ and catechol resistance regulon transcriptional repressor